MFAQKKSAVCAAEYAVVLLCFCFMYLFIIPQSDVFQFAQSTDGSLLSAVRYSLQYGNGRLLGNVIGVYFSTHFEYAGVIVAVGLVCLVALLNRLLFDDHPASVFPLTLMVAVPSVGIVKECYYLFAGFCNYVLPIILLLNGFAIYKKLLACGTRFGAWAVCLVMLDLLCAAASCLFSENTTILVFVIALGMLLFPAEHSVCIRRFLWLHMGAVLVGCLVMILIPVVMQSGEKMDSYRQIAVGLSAIVEQCMISFSKFADVLNRFYLLLFVFCAAMILLCLGETRGNAGSKTKRMRIAFFVCYPFVCLFLNQMDPYSEMASRPMMMAADAVLAFIFLCDVVVSAFLVEEKKERVRCLFMTVVTAFSVAPMMIVSVSSHRTYYTTFVCMALFSVLLIKRNLPSVLRKALNAPWFHRYVGACAAVCFGLLTVHLFLMSVYNYDFYVLRSDDMVSKINGEEAVYVPALPADTIGIESPWTPIVYYFFPAAADSEKAIVSLSYWDKYGQFATEIVDHPLYAVSFAFEHWQYKDPLYPASLCS